MTANGVEGDTPTTNNKTVGSSNGMEAWQGCNSPTLLTAHCLAGNNAVRYRAVAARDHPAAVAAPPHYARGPTACSYAASCPTRPTSYFTSLEYQPLTYTNSCHPLFLLLLLLLTFSLAMLRLLSTLVSVWALVCVSGVSAQSNNNYTGTFTSIPIPYSGACQNARGMAIDPSNNNIYVACGTNASVIVMDNSGTFIKNFTLGVNAWSPFGIAFSGSSMYVTSLWTNMVYQFNKDTGAMVTSWSQYLNLPWGIAVDGSGNVFVANYGQGNVLKYSGSGQPLQNFSTTGPAMYFPEEIAIDSSNNVYATHSTATLTSAMLH